MNLLKSNPVIYVILTLILYFYVSWFKVYHFTNSPKFNFNDDTLLFWSESATQYRTARTFATGKIPDSIDYRMQFPEGIRTFAELTTTAELVIGSTYRFLPFSVRNRLPFHVYLIYFVSFFSSLTIITVFLVTKLILNDYFSALCAGTFYAFSRASFVRTIPNFLLEDFALPLIFLSIYFFLTALKEKSYPRCSTNILVSTALLIIALTSWHFTRFYLLIFAGSLSVTYLFYGVYNVNVSTQELKNRWFFILIILTLFIVLSSFIIPVLRYHRFYFSTAILIMYAIIFVYFTVKFVSVKYKYMPISLPGVLFIMLILCMILITPEGNNYQHVTDLFKYKLLYLGRRPDAGLMSFDARVLWVEDFATPPVSLLLTYWGTTLILGLWGMIIYFKVGLRKILVYLKVKGTLKKIYNDTIAFPPGLTLIYLSSLSCLMLSLLVVRMTVFTAFFLAIFTGVTINYIRYRIKNPKTNLIAVSVLGLISLFAIIELHEMVNFNRDTVIKKSLRTLFPVNVVELAIKTRPYLSRKDMLGLIYWVRNNTPVDSVFLTSYALGPAILTYTNRPIVLHPKFESATVRTKFKMFLDNLYNGTETTFYEYCKTLKINYFVYQVRFYNETGPGSYRDMSLVKEILPGSLIYKFQFQQHSTNRFTVVYQNQSITVYRIN